uniref:Transmembrane protein n=1 Tax=Rhizophora mucronata TaxID=61149 RepID=A0A2P2P133_RHIMU
MGIQEKLLEYKYHIIFMLIISLILVSLIFVAPSFLTILAYFWPLYLSTALFLGAVIFFGKISSPAAQSSGDKAGEGLLKYVAGQPEQPVESSTSE